MNELIKKTQTVLVYCPGMGGEYIACMKTPKSYRPDLLTKHGLMTSFTDTNKWVSCGFPREDFLRERVMGLQSLSKEYTPEQRLTFKTQKEAFDYLYKIGLDPHKTPPYTEPLLNNAWLSVHWHYGLWEDHWKWVDWDNDDWIYHWGICHNWKFKNRDEDWTKLDDISYNNANNNPNWLHDHINWFRLQTTRYKEYFNKHFPNNGFNIDRKDGELIDYKGWARNNLKALEGQDFYKQGLVPDYYLKKFKSVIDQTT